MAKYRFIEDPGHGWLEVPLSELHNLGIADDISACSYISNAGGTTGKLVYLEEDCDLAVFCDALRAQLGDLFGSAQAWFDANVTEIYQENTFIRDLPHYGS